MAVSKKWWQRFLKQRHFPERGHFLIVPQDEDGYVELMHGETQRAVPMNLDDGETLNDCAAFFRTVLPQGEVAAPSGSSEVDAWWVKRLGTPPSTKG